MIILDRVSKKYGYVWALRDVSLQIEYPGIYLFHGPNGCGKTTLLKLICGIARPSYGEVKVYSCDPITDWSKIWRRISFTFEWDPLPWWTTGRKYLEYVCFMRGTNLYEHLDVIRLLDINKFWNRKIFTYSSGMKRRVQIAKSLINESDIMVLDEPLTFLDRTSRKNLIKYFSSISGNRIILIASHILDGLQNISRHIIEMLDGEVVEIV